MRTVVRFSVLFWAVLLIGQAERASFEDLAARATAARDSKDPARAIGLYQQALEANPKWTEGWWYLGTLLYDSDRYAEGRDALRRLIALQPNAAPALQILGLCEFETGDYAASLEHIERGMTAEAPAPQMEAVLRFHRAMLLTHAGQFDKALAEYVWFARKGVHNSSLVMAVGAAALRTPVIADRIPTDKRALLEEAGKAAYASMSGDFNSAQAALTDLVQHYPDAHYVHYLYGCFLLAKEPDTAADELRRELKITPGSGAANAMLAWAFLQRGDAAAALPYAKKAAESEAGASLPEYVLGRALLEEGAVDRAIPHLESAETIDPTNLDTHVLLATAYSSAGHPAEARRERLQSLALWEGKAAGEHP